MLTHCLISGAPLALDAYSFVQYAVEKWLALACRCCAYTINTHIIYLCFWLKFVGVKFMSRISGSEHRSVLFLNHADVCSLDQDFLSRRGARKQARTDHFCRVLCVGFCYPISLSRPERTETGWKLSVPQANEVLVGSLGWDAALNKSQHQNFCSKCPVEIQA